MRTMITGMCCLKHCRLCGNHHGHPGPYCHPCLEHRWEMVEKDARARALLGMGKTWDASWCTDTTGD